MHEVGQALNSERNTEKKSLSNAEKVEGRKDQEKERQTKSNASLIVNIKSHQLILLDFSDDSHAKQAK